MSISKDLSLLSSSPETSKGRLIKESYSQTRSEFQRDRDRILHSAAFRRLKHKTQVFVSHEAITIEQDLPILLKYLKLHDQYAGFLI
tara:strand:+ start:529 stop:789 length:261 start_codon:yes stop_codon:yes gene_type:complete